MKGLKKLIVSAAVTLFSISTLSLDVSNLNGAFSLLTLENNDAKNVAQVNLVKNNFRGENSYSVSSEARNEYDFQNIEFYEADGNIFANISNGITSDVYQVIEITDFNLNMINVNNPYDTIILSYNKFYNEFDYETYYRGLEDYKDEELKDKLYDFTKNHTVLGYDTARRKFFGEIDNIDGYVECVYTGKMVKTDGIPDGNIMNCEHTWPQSKFGGADVSSQKSDIHHLYPTDSKANSRRSSYNFGEVIDVKWSDSGSKLGDDEDGYTKFEPRDEHKGDVARTLFYFAVRYKRDIASWEESVLRKWAKEDPVDEKEFARNAAIEEFQHNRNPFVDSPELIDQISDF